MDLMGIPPPVMNWNSSNLPEQWDRFQTHVELIFSGPLSEREEEEKVSYLLLWVGEEGRQIYKSWTISADESKLLKTYYDRFKEYVQPKLNPIFARFRFYKETQEQDTIDTFVTRLRIRARDCNFRYSDTVDITDDMIRDRIVIGCNDQRVREKLINEGDKLTMDRAIHIAQNHEYCQKQLSFMTLNAPTNVDAVGQKRSGARPKQQTKSGLQSTSRECDRCGFNHDNNSVCPAKGKKCRKCKKMNHFQRKCRSNKFVNNVNENVGEGCENTEYSVNTVSASSSSTTSPDRRDSLFVTLQVGPNITKINFKVDTGSSANIIPSTMFKLLGIKNTLEKPDCKLIAYSGDMLKTRGMLNLNCSYRGSKVNTRFYFATEFPSRPYEKIGVDLFHLDGKNYLLTIDYYSRYFEVDYLQDTKSSTVIQKLRAHMSRYGICDTLISDNGPQFISEEFKQFSNSWQFTHITSSPRYPKGNGLAEKGVGIAKKLMKKAVAEKQSPYISFLEYRNTPLECGYSPAQLLLGRRTKSFIPITGKSLLPQQVDLQKVQRLMSKSKSKQKSDYDKSARKLKPLDVNDSVRIQMNKTWKQAKVIKKLNNRSYIVQTRDGCTYRRNRKHLNPTSENVTDINPFSTNILLDKTSLTVPQESEKSPKYDPGRYVTRSGRVVKKNQRFTGDEWQN